MSPSARLLKPDDRDRLSNLQMLARQVVDGLTVGMHGSPHKGFGVEFKEHRPYVLGDEVRAVDWKLYGKTDRLYIRQYEEETSLGCFILVDQSGSMAYSGKRSGGVSKHAYAIRLAACLAYLLISQQDAVGLVTFDTEIRELLPPGSKPSHLRGLLECLAESRAQGETRLSDVLAQMVPKIRRRGLLVLISDCFDDVDALLKTLAFFRHAKHEVIIFQVWDPDEIDWPFRRRIRFRSLETPGTERLIDPTLLRTDYLENLEKYRAKLSQGCGRQRIELVPCTTDQSHANLLSMYLSARGRAK